MRAQGFAMLIFARLFLRLPGVRGHGLLMPV
jgi:hypothetical protein